MNDFNYFLARAQKFMNSFPWVYILFRAYLYDKDVEGIKQINYILFGNLVNIL